MNETRERADDQRLRRIRCAPKMPYRLFGMISAASEAKIVDLENILQKTTSDLIWRSVDISNYTLPKDSDHHSEITLDDAVLKPFIRDYAEYTQKGKLELGNINSGAIQQELIDLMPSNPLGQEFPSWRPLLELFVWAVDPEAGAGERFCERVNAARRAKISGTFP
jgi:hypothetical protein